jgi:hypothetical protein
MKLEFHNFFDADQASGQPKNTRLEIKVLMRRNDGEFHEVLFDTIAGKSIVHWTQEYSLTVPSE